MAVNFRRFSLLRLTHRTIVIVPGLTDRSTAKTFGISGRVSAKRLLRASNAITAMGYFARLCWNPILLSIVSNKSKRFWAFASRAPFFRPAQPISGTDSTLWPGKSRRRRQSRFSSRRIFTSCRLQNLPARGFKQGDYLLPLHTGKPLQEIVDGIARLKVVEETLDWNAGASEYWRSAKNLRVRMNEGFETHAKHCTLLTECGQFLRSQCYSTVGGGSGQKAITLNGGNLNIAEKGW